VNLWYLDDGNIVLPLALVPKVLKILESEEAKNAGLFLNTSKSCLFSFNWEEVLRKSTFDTQRINQEEWLIFENCKIPIERHGVKLLGCPLGSENFVSNF
jgi:hypothetical protein